MTEPPTVLTTVHLLRHGEVFNPRGVLYGRLPGYGLSDLGHAMAARLAEVLAPRDIAAVVASPMQRAQETAAPTAEKLGLPVRTDERLIEAANVFEGSTFGVGDGSLRHPRHWWHLRNPFRPSWGEPYREQAARMLVALDAARDAAAGREALCVSHQLPIWIARCAAEGRRLWHDPRERQCTLASLTSFTYAGPAEQGGSADTAQIVSVTYTEPARDLLPATPARRNQAGA